MDSWCDERNHAINVLRALVLDTPERKAAMRWAIQRLEGMPEHWVDVGLAVDLGMDADAFRRATS